MKLKFLAVTSIRYLFRNISSFFSITGIGIGVMTLITVLAIMDGFQSGYIESILDIDSYHLRLKNIPSNSSYEELARNLLRIDGVESVVPFTESKAIIRGSYSSPSACIIRGISPEAYTKDKVFKKHLDIIRGVFNIDIPYGIVIGSELADRIGIDVGDTVELFSISNNVKNGLIPVKRAFLVTGIFKSGYYDFDLSWGFISLAQAGSFFWQGGSYEVTLGIRIKNRFHDLLIRKRIMALIGKGKSSGNIISWREYNKSYFNALLMEKIMMFVLLSLIFIVVGFNIYHSQRRSVYEKTEDIAILKAIGAKPLTLRRVFMLEGLLIGVFGGILGTGFGFFLSININEIFSLIENLINWILFMLFSFWQYAGFSGTGYPGGNEFSIFSPVYFYLNKVPVKLYIGESVGIVAFGIVISLLASYFASKRVLSVKPVEILRNQ